LKKNLDAAVLLPSIPAGEKPTKKAFQAYHKQSLVDVNAIKTVKV
jgi:hypothetical protein